MYLAHGDTLNGITQMNLDNPLEKQNHISRGSLYTFVVETIFSKSHEDTNAI